MMLKLNRNSNRCISLILAIILFCGIILQPGMFIQHVSALGLGDWVTATTGADGTSRYITISSTEDPWANLNSGRVQAVCLQSWKTSSNSSCQCQIVNARQGGETIDGWNALSFDVKCNVIAIMLYGARYCNISKLDPAAVWSAQQGMVWQAIAENNLDAWAAGHSSEAVAMRNLIKENPEGYDYAESEMIIAEGANDGIQDYGAFWRPVGSKHRVKFLKTSEETGEQLTGAKYAVTGPNGYSETLTLPTDLMRLDVGEYVFKELEAPENYALNPLPVTVTIEKDETITLTDKKRAEYGTIIFQKTDESRTDTVLVPDTEYAIYKDEALTTYAQDMFGKQLKNLKSDSGRIVVPNVMMGDYYIRETMPPDGYAIQPKTFKITVKMSQTHLPEEFHPDEKDGIHDRRQLVKLEMVKKNAEKDEVVSGAVYQLIADTELIEATTGTKIPSGTTLGYFITDSEGRISVDKMGSTEIKANGKTFEAVNVLGLGSVPLVNGKYHFVEVSAPDKYLLNSDPIYFDATWKPNNTDNGVTDGNRIISEQGYYMTVKAGTTNPPTKLTVQKILFDKDGNPVKQNGNVVPIKDAMMKIVDKNGNICEFDGEKCEWISDGTPKVFSKVPAGTYYISELAPPETYKPAHEMKIEVKQNESVDFEFGNQQANITIYKTDKDGNKLANANLQIEDKDHNVIYEWVSSTEGKTFPMLPAGTYTIVETKAPDGYKKGTKEFTIYNTHKDLEFTIENEPLVSVIEKTDLDSEHSPIGAKLAIMHKVNGKDEVVSIDGKELIWVTDGSKWIIERLPVGEYFLRELQAPKGYYKSEDVPFTVTDQGVNNVDVKSDMKNQRTLGTFKITKIEGETKQPMEGIKFDLISVNHVQDPVTKKVLFLKDQVITTLTTDQNGVAEFKNKLPIGLYYEDGKFEPITYRLKETSTYPGQYHMMKDIDFTFDWNNDEDKIVTKEFKAENFRPHITVKKTVKDPQTFVGNEADKKDITVLVKGDIITYNILVENTGLVSARNIVIKDKIPANTKFVSTDNIGHYDAKTNTVYWNVKEINGNSKKILTLKVQVTTPKAAEINNIAQYAYPEYLPSIGEDYMDPMDPSNPWEETDNVIHQVIEFHKASKIPGGKDTTDFSNVHVGDTIHYELTVKTADIVNKVIVTDPIPNGLTYVDGSAKVTTPGAEKPKEIKCEYNKENNTLKFNSMPLAVGSTKIEFDVTVDKVEFGNKFTHYVNKAQIEVQQGPGAIAPDPENPDPENPDGPNVPDPEKPNIPNKNIDIESETISHGAKYFYTVEKHGEVKTFEGDLKKNEPLKGLTAVHNGDQITYTILIKNKGTTPIREFKVVDYVPGGLKLVSQSATNNAEYVFDETTGRMTWMFKDIKENTTASIKIVCQVNTNDAQIFVNTAHYTDKPDAPEEEMKATNDVAHQIVEFHKESEIKGGNNKDNATVVSAGDIITYVLTLKNAAELKNVVISDVVPDGLSLVPNTIDMRVGADSDWGFVADEDAFDANTNKITITLPYAKANTYQIRFDAKVNRIKMDSEKLFENTGKLEFETDVPETLPVDPEDPVPPVEPPVIPPKKEIVDTDKITHITDVKLTGKKYSTDNTFVGSYEERTNVTLVKYGDKIEYVIELKNEGKSNIHNVVVNDRVPEFTKFESVANNGVYDEANNKVQWKIPVINSGETVKLHFVVVCDTKDAVEIRNKATYSIQDNLDDIQNAPDEEWFLTDEVIHQTATITKSSSIKTGSTEKEAKSVEVKKPYTYTIEVTTTNPVYGMQVTDKLPDNVKFVKGTAKINYPDGKTEEVKVNVEKNILSFPVMEETQPGTTQFTFDVVIEKLPELDKDFFLPNTAKVEISTSKDSDKTIELDSNTIVHKVLEKSIPKEEDDPKLGFEGTDEIVVWTLIATISMVACGVFVYEFRRKKQ